MDAIVEQFDFPSHFEYTAKSLKGKDINLLKKRAYKMMSQLEGWCSNEKASILIDLIVKTKPNIIVEIGVFGGKSLIPMAAALKHNKEGKIYGVDPWSEIASAEGMDGQNLDWWSSINHHKILSGLQKKIREFQLESQIELIISTSEACPDIPNIDILHIDGNHSEKTSLIDVLKWVPLVKKGGVIVFDDVNWSTTKLAVEWLNENCEKVGEYHGDNIWGIWTK